MFTLEGHELAEAMLEIDAAEKEPHKAVVSVFVPECGVMNESGLMLFITENHETLSKICALAYAQKLAELEEPPATVTRIH